LLSIIIVLITLLQMLAACSAIAYSNGDDDTVTDANIDSVTTKGVDTQPQPADSDDTSDPEQSGDGKTDLPEQGDVIITEVMTSNTKTVADGKGEYCDWIELYNSSDRNVSLKHFCLSDDENDLCKSRLPDFTLASHEYALIFASGTSGYENGEISVSFKISSGESVYLAYENTVFSRLATPEDLPSDISYGLAKGKDGEGCIYAYFATATPGTENVSDYSQVLSELSVTGSGIVINEFMMDNKAFVYDEDGDCPDWVEIRNCSENSVSLSGYGLSDNFDNHLKWTFPDVTLESGGYILVMLSGKSKKYDYDSVFLHADFKLSESDDGLMLSDEKGVIIDRIAAVRLPENASFGRDPDDVNAWKFFTRPTPGKENGKNGFESLEIFEAALSQKVYISEVCAVSSTSVSSLPDSDWIEICNNTDDTVNLAGWSISKYISDMRYYVFPEVTVAPHGYLVISASGAPSVNTKSLDAGFKVSRSGNTIYLVDSEGYIADSFDTGLQRAGITSGRVIEGNTLSRYFFTEPTKGKANSTGGAKSSYALPAAIESSSDTLIADSHTVTISTLQKNAAIYYTLDGTTPDDNCERYTAPITLDSSASVRAIVYSDGLIPSEISTATFLVDRSHTLNVVCLTCDPDDLFGYTNGIWANGPGWTEKSPHYGANYWKDWEREVYFEFYEKDGTLGLGFSAGIKNHGQFSRAQSQKSVSINMKEAYGSGTINYPFFGSDELSTFDNLLLRTAGQDANNYCLIDAYCERLVNGVMDIDLMRDLPVAVYVNGQYWGLYYLRDKINESYIYYRTGIEEDDLDAIKGNAIVETGSITAHSALLTYIRNHNLSNQEYFDYVASQIDLEEWTNYWITQSFLANTDTGNIRFYRSKSGGKWRWILFDLDWALNNNTYTWNMIEEFIDARGHGVSNAFSTTIAVGLFKNAEFKTYFIEKYAEYMHTVFAVDRMLEILDQMLEEIRDEMVYHCERWNVVSYSRWEKNITALKKRIAERWDYSKGDLKETFKLSDAYMKQLFPD